MPFDFDEENGATELDGLDTETVAQQGSTAVDAAVESFYEEDASEATNDSVDAQLAAVEQRLAVAQCYRQLLDNSLFTTPSPAALSVENEIIDFVRQRLAVLMGVRTEASNVEAAQAQFTEQQADVLRRVADKVINAESEKNKVSALPTLNRVTQEPPAPQSTVRQVQQAPVQKPVQPRPQPVIAKTPQVQRQVPASRPTIGPQLRKPGQPPPRPAGVQPPPRTVRPKIDESRIPTHYRGDPSLQIKNGKVLVHARNTEGEPLYAMDPTTKQTEPVMKDITLPARSAPGSAQPIPAPSMLGGAGSQFSQVMASSAEGMLSLAEKKTNRLGVSGQFAGTLLQTIAAKQGDSEPETEGM